VLSGGERTRVSLARIIVSEANVLFLDEPTNYFDLPSLEALEDVLTEYQGTIVFASHDRHFINKLANNLIIIKHGKLCLFQGNYDQYLSYQNEQERSAVKEDKVILEYRLSEVLSRLSVTKEKAEVERLDKEYRELLAMVKLFC
jgi:macrolide transport system ATP-binding/permease protein